MKKLMCLIFCVVLLFCSCVITGAESTTNYLYEERFIEEYVYQDVIHKYKEVYYHYDDNGKIEWCLIYATASAISMDMAVQLKIDDFILSAGSIIRPFVFRYAVYDVKNDRYVDFIKDYDELSNYDGLFDVLRTVEHSFIIGDSDHDGVLSIIDANIIQSALVGNIELRVYEYTDYRTHKSSNYYDVDDDSEFSVMDATAIQMKLAKK